MSTVKKASIFTAMALGLSLSLPGASWAANCATDVKKAQAQWEKIEKKIESGEYEGGGKSSRSLEGLIRRAGEAGEAGKNKKCAKLLKKVRSRWEEKGYK